MTDVKTIATERLLLRAPRMQDWPDYAAFMATGRALYMGGPFPEVVAWGMFCHDAALWLLAGHGGLMIEHRESGQCIGQVSINAGPIFPEIELGWMLYPGWEGRGFALEAASAMRRWAFGERGLETLVSYVHPDNAPARRLAERLGAVVDADAPKHDPSDIVYRHSRI